MATIIVTEDNQTVEVKNGDTVVVDIPGGGTVNIIAANDNAKTFRIDYGDDDNVADNVIIDLSTFAKYGLHIDINNYDDADSVSLLSAFGTHVDAGNEDEFNFSYVGNNGVTYDGYVRAKDKGEKDFTDNPAPIVICFAQGTEIDAEFGPSPIEGLSPDDRIMTRDRGLQPVRWIGRRVLDSIDLARHPQLKPVCFRAGSLGQGLPVQDLIVSPQHRMLVNDWRTELYFGTDEVLAPAIGFINDTNIFVEDFMPTVTYFHLLFDHHEIVRANGVWAESLHAGEMAMRSMTDAARRELNLIFPDAPKTLASRETARQVARRGEAAAALAAA